MFTDADIKNINNIISKSNTGLTQSNTGLTQSEEKTAKKVELLVEKISINDKYLNEVRPIDEELKKLSIPEKKAE